VVDNVHDFNAALNDLRGQQRGSNEPLGSWMREAQTNDKGTPLDNLANCLLALRKADQLRGCFARDDMQRAPMLVKPIPGMKAEDLPAQVNDNHVTALQEWLQLNGLPKISKDVCHQAVDLRCEEMSFHPVKEYLNGLKWDGVPRVKGWLHTYLGAEYTPYTQGIGRFFLVALVARIMDPGCKADYMLILEGPQGAHKSTACSIMAGKWFSDSLPDIRDKDSSGHLRGKWLIEVGELSSFTKAEDRALKAFVTRTVERYRPSFGRKDVVEPRQCLFVGTTNESTYLKDATGGRRYWPVKTGSIDVTALRAARDQIFAEAVTLYREGAQWWPDREFEAEHIKPEQEQRFSADAWEERLSDWLDGKDKVSLVDVCTVGLNLPIDRVGRREQDRVIEILLRLGWIQHRLKNGRVWRPKG